jgi:hypothetical protein
MDKRSSGNIRLRTLMPSERRKEALRLLGGADRIVRGYIQAGLRLLDDVAADPPPHLTGRTILGISRDILAAADAVQVLLEQGAADTALPNARVLLELTASMVYLGRRNDERVAFGRQLLGFDQAVENFENERSRILRANPDHDRRYLDEMVEYFHRTRDEFEPDSHLRRPVEREIARLREESDGPVRWYSLFGGPRSIRRLFVEAQLTEVYDSCYRSWSQAAHGTNAFHPGLLTSDNPVGYLAPLRECNMEKAAKLIGVTIICVMSMVDILAPYAGRTGAEVLEHMAAQVGEAGLPDDIAIKILVFMDMFDNNRRGGTRVANPQESAAVNRAIARTEQRSARSCRRRTASA